MKSETKKRIYKFVNNNGIQAILATLVLIIIIVALFILAGGDDTLQVSEVVDLTVFSAVIFAVLLDAISKLVSPLILNRMEDDVKLDSNYEKLAKRYPPINPVESPMSPKPLPCIDPLITYTNSQADHQSVHSLTKSSKSFEGSVSPETAANKKLRFPVVQDWANFNSCALFEIHDSLDKYEPPAFIEDHRVELLQAHGTSNVYNQTNVRVQNWEAAEMETGRTRFTIQTNRTTYFDSLITNRAMDFAIEDELTIRDMFQPGPFVPSLKGSVLSNHLGYNGFIVSSDGEIPLVKRSKSVSIGKDTYGTSIGASLKAKYCLDAQRQFTIEGLVQSIKMEILDELGIDPESIIPYSENREDVEPSSNAGDFLAKCIIAAYRDLVEGGKPQLLFVVQSTLTKSEIEDKFYPITKTKSEKWDKEGRERQDGKKLAWVKLHDLEKHIAISPDCVTYGNMAFPMMPSAAASFVMLVEWHKALSAQ